MKNNAFLLYDQYGHKLTEEVTVEKYIDEI